MEKRKLIYPILLKNAPNWFANLLRDSGVPVAQSKEESDEYSIIICDGSTDVDVNSEKKLIISWNSLLPDIFQNDNDIMQSLYMPSKICWIENGIPLTENCISDNLRQSIIQNLSRKVSDHGLPWICFNHCPAEYDNVFNFRIDIDENEPDDWKRVIKALQPVSHATTWFLNVSATEKSPIIYKWLKDSDIHSHGYHHHIHKFDDRLNRMELQKANEILNTNECNGRGFAPPCGRISSGLQNIAAEMKYQFISALGDPNGGLPIRDHHGVWQIHSLPISEGLYLDNNISNSEIIIQGYLAMAMRAFENHKPLLLYGHAERRLGRKPEIISLIIDELNHMGKFWQVSLTKYIQWLNQRNTMNFNVVALNDENSHFQLSWSHTISEVKPQVNFIWKDHVQQFAMKDYSGTFNITMDQIFESLINKETVKRAEIKVVSEPVSLKIQIRETLDWERETPPAILFKGGVRSRVKAILRWLTDNRWRKKQRAKEWKLYCNECCERSKAA